LEEHDWGNVFFALSILIVGMQLAAMLAIDHYALGSPYDDLISGRVIHKISGFIGFSMLWSGSTDLGTLVLLPSPFHWFPYLRRQKVQ
jgi:hypothetical protein